MKKVNFLTVVILVALSVSFISCEKENIDTQKPTIQILEPGANEHLLIGDEEGVHFEVEFADNIALKSYKVDIHSNFDGHTHSHAPAKVQATTTADSVAFSYNNSWNDILDKKNATVHHHDIKIPAMVNGQPVKEGNYHLLVYCVDKAGNESFEARDIVLTNNPDEVHEHDHEHEH